MARVRCAGEAASCMRVGWRYTPGRGGGGGRGLHGKGMCVGALQQRTWHGTRPTPSRGKTSPGPGGGPQPLPVSPVDLRASRVWSVQGGVGRAGGGRRAPRCLYPQDGGIRRPPCGLRVYGVA